MGPDELDNNQIRSYITVDDGRIELLNNWDNEVRPIITDSSEPIYTNALHLTEASDSIYSYIQSALSQEELVTTSGNTRIDILNEIKKMPTEEKQEMLMALLDAFDDIIKEKTEATEKILKVNRLRQIFGSSKNSAS